MSPLLDDFKGTATHIRHKEWKLNMVGTARSDQTGANVKDVVDKMKAGMYKSCFWQHNNKNLVYPAWSDNAIVKTLSNHHGAISLDAENGSM